MSADSKPAVVWFRNDLRLADHAALAAAAEAGPLVCCFVLDAGARPAAGGASRWWLHGSLEALGRSLESLGGRLILRRGPAREALPALLRETGALSVHCSASPDSVEQAEEAAVDAALIEAGGELCRHPGVLLHDPSSLRTQSGRPYQVFTPFWKTLRQTAEIAAPLPAPSALRFAALDPATDDLADWRLRPTRPDWAAGLDETWTPGEAGAVQCLERFVTGRLAGYAAGRDRPDEQATSALSPHLHFGELSPRQVWHAVRQQVAHGAAASGDGEPFLRQLGWREFSYHLLHHWPALPTEPFRPRFAEFPWQDNEALLRCWQRGRTGYPIVDAGMRQLWQTGWMHNRVRMIAASFLVKDLLVPWQQGEAWFWDTLVDADIANNAASWQWVAGSGADAAPYFRIFNPVLQGRKFDPEGRYVRRWLPELARLPDRHIHAPWSAPAAELDAAGIVLGRDYPEPVVDHAEARRRALDAYALLPQERA